MDKVIRLATIIFLGLVLSTEALAWDHGQLEVQASPEELCLSEAYLKANLGGWQVSAGLQQLQWGPGKAGDLFLSTEGSLWGVTAVTSWQLWDYEITTQQLIASVDPALNKVLFAHRLESEIKPGVTIGLAESVIATGEFTPWLFNPIPFWPFYLTQHLIIKHDPLQDRLINVNLSLDASIRRSSGTEVYGQLFIDDAQQDLDRRDTVPDWGGFLVGVSSEELGWWPGWSGTAEYILITNWTYTHKNVDNSYILADGTPVGHWLGPDADAIVLRFDHKFALETTGRLRLQWERHGEGVMGEGWLPEYQKDNLFLSGVVEKRYTVGVGVTKALSKGVGIESELAWTIKQNADNVLGAQSSTLCLTAEATWQI